MDFLDIDTANECQFCGTHVTPEFARQFGDRTIRCIAVASATRTGECGRGAALAGR